METNIIIDTIRTHARSHTYTLACSVVRYTWNAMWIEYFCSGSSLFRWTAYAIVNILVCIDVSNSLNLYSVHLTPPTLIFSVNMWVILSLHINFLQITRLNDFLVESWLGAVRHIPVNRIFIKPKTIADAHTHYTHREKGNRHTFG